MEPKRFALTIDVESDHFRIKFEDVDDIYYLLDLFEDLHVQCTFFFTGRFIENMPEVVSSAATRGHEIALHGYAHENWEGDTRKKIEDLEKLGDLMLTSNIRAVGFRAPLLSINRNILRRLGNMGFTYDSSLFQNSVTKLISVFAPHLYDQELTVQNPYLTEIPISRVPLFGVPYCLNWLLLIGPKLYKTATESYKGKMIVFYMHPYDLWSRPKRLGIPIPLRFLSRNDSKEVLRHFLEYLLNRRYKFVRLKDELSKMTPQDHLEKAQ